MADKKIVFSAGIDTSAFDRGIEQLKQKMQGLNVGNNQNPNMVAGSGPYVDSLQQKRHSDILEKAGWGNAKVGEQNAKNVDASRLGLLKQIDAEHNKELDNRKKIEDVLGKLKKREDDINKVIQERQKLGQSAIDQEEKLQKIKEQSKNRENAVKESEKREQILAEQKIYLSSETERETKREKSKRPSQAISDTLSGNPLREGASILASFAPELAALYAGLKILKDFQGMTAQNISEKGKTTQQSSELSGRNIFDKTLSTDLYYGEEKKKSLEQSDLTFSEKIWPMIKLASRSALEGGLDDLGIVESTGRSQTAFEEDMKQTQIGKSQGIYSGLVNQGFLKKEGLEAWQKNSERNLPMQRTLGLSDSQMLSGSYVTGGQNAGFETDKTLSSSQRILAAGGTSTAGRELATSANVLERDARLSNAQEMLGKLSSTGMRSKDSEDLLLKIFEKGTQKGVDSSKFAQENRKYMEATVDIVKTLGVTDKQSGLDIEKTLSAFVDRNAGERQQEAGKSAYQSFQEMTRSGEGPQNIIRQVSMGKKFDKLSGEEVMTLSQLGEEELNAKGPMVQSLAAKQGLTVTDFIKQAKESQEEGFTIRKDLEEKRKSLKEKYGSSENEKKMEEDIKAGNFKDTEWSSFSSGMRQTDRQVSRYKVDSPEERRYLMGLIKGKMRSDEEVSKDQEDTSKLPMSGLMKDHDNAAKANMERVSNLENIKSLDPINKAIRGVEGASTEQLRSMLKLPELLNKGAASMDDFVGVLIKSITAFQEGAIKLKSNPLNFNNLPGTQQNNGMDSFMMKGVPGPESASNTTKK